MEIIIFGWIITIRNSSYTAQVIYAINKEISGRLPNTVHNKIERIKLVRRFSKLFPPDCQERAGLGPDETIRLSTCKSFVEDHWI